MTTEDHTDVNNGLVTLHLLVRIVAHARKPLRALTHHYDAELSSVPPGRSRHEVAEHFARRHPMMNDLHNLSVMGISTPLARPTEDRLATLDALTGLFCLFDRLVNRKTAAEVLA